MMLLFIFHSQDRREGGGVTRVVTRRPGGLEGPVENKDIGYEFSCYGLELKH